MLAMGHDLAQCVPWRIDPAWPPIDNTFTA
jgi:hypothetical protein